MKQKALILCLGLLTALVAVYFTVTLAFRKTEADLLVEVLTSGDAADAAWAFERLKEIEIAQLGDLLPHFRREETTPLRGLYWSRPGGFHLSGSRAQCYRVGEVVQFVLTYPLLGRVESEERSPGLLERCREALRKTHRARGHGPGSRLKRWFDPVTPPAIPPSKDPLTASLANGGSAEALLSFFKGADRAGGVWAMERLRGLPDEELGKLLPLASSRESAPFEGYFWVGKSGTSGDLDLASVGQVVRFLIAERLGLFSMISTPDPASPEDLVKLSTSWNERLVSASPAAGPKE